MLGVSDFGILYTPVSHVIQLLSHVGSILPRRQVMRPLVKGCMAYIGDPHVVQWQRLMVICRGIEHEEITLSASDTLVVAPCRHFI